MNKEIKERIKSILSVLVFLTVTTWYWYGPREDLMYLSANAYKYNRKVTVKTEGNLKLQNSEYEFKVYNKTNQVQNYQIIVMNDYITQRKNNCKLLSNNYLKYDIKLNNDYHETRNLGSDGIVYRGKLNPKESKEFSIKMKIDKDDLTSSDCFYPTIKANTYNEI